MAELAASSADPGKSAPMMQKRVTMSVPSIKAKAGGRVEDRMPSAEPLLIVLTIGHSARTIETVPSAITE